MELVWVPCKLLDFFWVNIVQRKEDMIDHHSFTHNLNNCQLKIKPPTNSNLNGMRTHDFCDTEALPTELSTQLGAGDIVSS